MNDENLSSLLETRAVAGVKAMDEGTPPASAELACYDFWSA